jgi:hypothetical protein
MARITAPVGDVGAARAVAAARPVLDRDPHGEIEHPGMQAK